MGNTFIETVFANKELSSQKLGCQWSQDQDWTVAGKGWLQLQLNAAASEIEARKKHNLGSTALWCAKF